MTGRCLVILACFGVPAVIGTNYTLNYFYGHGAAVWDAGWFAYLCSGPLSWSPPNPPAMGGAFFQTHMSPVFVGLTALHHLVWNIPSPVFFALTQGVWHGILGGALGWIAWHSLPGRPLLALAAALLTAGNGVMLAALGFPHFEVAIPALLAATLGLRLTQCRLWLLPLFALLTIREDAGLQLAGIFGLLGLWRVWHRQGTGWLDLAIATTGIVVTALTMAIQHHVFPTTGPSQMEKVYLGTPAFAHLTAGFLHLRVERLLTDRSYVWLPLAMAAAVAFWRRDIRLSLGLIACTPWLITALIAVAPQAGTLYSYYGLPFMVGLVWPLFCAAPVLQPQTPSLYAVLQTAMSAASIALFALFGAPNHDLAPWRNAGFAWVARIAPTTAAVDQIVDDRAQFGALVVDDAVAALRMDAFGPKELHYAASYTLDQRSQIDTVIYQPDTWGEPYIQEIIAASVLTEIQPIPGTPFLIARRAARQ